MLNLNQLRIFYEVARTRSVVRAAEKLFISQPAVSTGLKKLQHQYGISLFTKEGRNLSLTKDGEQLLEISERIFSSELEAESLLHSLRSPQSITLNIGLVTLYERSGLVDLISKFQTINNKIKLSIHSGNSRSLIEQLLLKQIDMAIASNVTSARFKNCFFYKKHRIYLIVPKGHRLYSEKLFSPADIQGERVVLKEPGSAVRAGVDSYLKKNGLSIDVFAEFSNFDSMLEVMLKNKCIAFFPDDIISHVNMSSDLFSILDTDQSPIEFSTYFYIRNIATYPENYQKYMAEIIDYIAKI
ncbi:MAG: LysR family transcriptional regulator [Mailhella sp.]|nr:LysR family transcriptional regulator [Mailhella sp.]